MSSTSATAPVDKRTTRKVVAASAIGTVVEYYDFALYGDGASRISPEAIDQLPQLG